MEQLSSPLSTGGAGVIFEYRVAAIMLCRMLREAYIPVGIQLPVSRVAFQQRNEGYLFDDIVAYAAPLGGAPRIQMQVKRNIRITGQDDEFIKVMATALDVCRTHTEEVREGSLLMGLAAGNTGVELLELADLTTMARGHDDQVSFLRLLRQGVTGRKLRTRYQHVVSAMTAASGAEDDTTIARLTHQVLTGLHVWPVLVGPDERDWRAELDGLAGLASHAARSAADILGHIYDLAEEFGPHSGLVSSDQLRRELNSRLGIRLSTQGTFGREQASHISVINAGNGTVIAGDTQVFYGLRIGH